MTGTSNFTATGVQHPGMTMQLCSVCTCAFNARMTNGPCADPACQKKFAGKMRSELQLAGMNCEGSLRKFGMVEPMLKQELAMAGCPNDMTEALLDCTQRSAATATYLGHRTALCILAEFESCTDTETADMLANQLIHTNKTVQHKLLAIQAAVLRLCMNSFPAPGHAFPMIQGIMTYEKSWGAHELATLKGSEEGRTILALPLHNENILAAKSSIWHESSQLANLQAAERAAFYADYPGTEALFACGAMKSTHEMLADMAMPTQNNCCVAQNFSNMAIDVQDSGVPSDIRFLRSERVSSKKMASNSLGVDMDKVNAYSGKPWDALTNPWWAEKKV